MNKTLNANEFEAEFWKRLLDSFTNNASLPLVKVKFSKKSHEIADSKFTHKTYKWDVYIESGALMTSMLSVVQTSVLNKFYECPEGLNPGFIRSVVLLWGGMSITDNVKTLRFSCAHSEDFNDVDSQFSPESYASNRGFVI